MVGLGGRADAHQLKRTVVPIVCDAPAGAVFDLPYHEEETFVLNITHFFDDAGNGQVEDTGQRWHLRDEEGLKLAARDRLEREPLRPKPGPDQKALLPGRDLKLNRMAGREDRLQKLTDHPTVRRMREISRERLFVVKVNDDREIHIALGKPEV